MVGENIPITKDGSLSADIGFIAAKKHSHTLNNIVKHLESVAADDLTSASVFIGETSMFIKDKLLEPGYAKIVAGSQLGVLKDDGSQVQIEELLGTEPIDFNKNMYGIWIPWQQILSRSAYQWFSRMSVKQASKKLDQTT